jgi:heavy metal translocating P-type ATPase
MLGFGGILLHLVLRFGAKAAPEISLAPLFAVLIGGGVPLTIDVARKVVAGEFGSDLLAVASIATSVWEREFLVGSIVVLMLSGGLALERYALHRASSVLDALARRMPQVAHQKSAEGISDLSVSKIAVGNRLVVFPHEICPVDGVVVEGHGVMDETYLTGEPFLISKAPGALVLSGAINGEAALTIEATKLAVDSRYARIMKVMEESQQNRPKLRRLGDRIGAWYTPFALAVAALAWAASGDRLRFLAVLVIATPCPVLIAIPVAIIGAISLSARRSIIIKDPAVLEQVDRCRTLIFDKTGTLTYGLPALTEVVSAPGFTREEVLRAAASLEQFSRHPLAGAVLAAAGASGVPLDPVSQISEKPGHGLSGIVAGRRVKITSRSKLKSEGLALPSEWTLVSSGMECIVLIEGAVAAAFRFHDEPRLETSDFLGHLRPRHGVSRLLLVSGDRESEVRRLARRVGIREVYFSQSPEEKLAIVRRETRRAKTLFVGDGINDAPALMAASVGVAFGPNSDIAVEAAGAVVLENSLEKIDELIHIGARMRAIALQSALGGMLLSAVGMIAAGAGLLLPLAGAVAQEVIDFAAVLNALRVALPPKSLTDFEHR